MNILLFPLLLYLQLQINDKLDYLVTQNLFYCNPYGNKCTCRHSFKSISNVDYKPRYNGLNILAAILEAILNNGKAFSGNHVFFA